MATTTSKNPGQLTYANGRSRPLQRNPTSRLPAKALSSPSSSSTYSSTSHSRPHENTDIRGAATGKKMNTSYKNGISGDGASIGPVRPSLNIPQTAKTPSPVSPQRSQTYGDTLEPSPGADTPPPPSLVSGSSVSSHDSPRSNVLRRKPSVIARYVSERQQPSKHSTFSQPLVQRIEIPQHETNPPQLINSTERGVPGVTDEYQRPPSVKTQEPVEVTYGVDGQLLSRRTPMSDTATTPSILYSASPSEFSHTTAATSLMSASPLASSSPLFGLRPFDPANKLSPSTPSESLGHPFFKQTYRSGTKSASSLPRPGTSSTASRIDTKMDDTEKESQQNAPGNKRTCTPVHPPELAHLNTAPPREADPNTPVRPSRNGTPTLSDQRNIQHVVQSNLPKLNTSQHRRNTSASSSASTGVISPARRLTPASGQMNTIEHSAVALSKSQPSLQSLQGSAIIDEDDRDIKTPDVMSKHKSRFGFFSRRPKQDNPGVKDVSKPARKGPAAGTGHEGYGKMSLRARSGSSSSAGSNSVSRSALSQRKGSHGSSKTSDLDDFLQERLSPVYLRGEAQGPDGEGRDSGSTFEEPSIFTPAVSSPETSHTSTSSVELPKPTLGPHSHGRQASSGAASTFESSVSDSGRPLDTASRVPSEQTTTTTTRSSSRKRLVKPRASPNKSALRAASDHKKSQSSTALPRPEAQDFPTNASVQDGKPVWSVFPKMNREPKQPGKWNFLQRMNPSGPPGSQQAELGSRDSLSGPADTSAHYLPADASTRVDAQDLNELMQEASGPVDGASDDGTDFEDLDDDLLLQLDPLKAKPRSVADEKIGLKEFLMDSQIEVPEVRATACTQKVTEREVPKQSRLTPVGRIPPVGSKRDHVHKPPNLSFSRPFAGASPKPGVHSPPLSATLSLFPSTGSHSHQSSAGADGLALTMTAAPAHNDGGQPLSLKLNTTMRDMAPSQPFLDYSPRKSSVTSHSGSSATMHFPTATTIAHPPGGLSQTSADEAWPEFDDLIDLVLTPSPSASSRQSKQLIERPDSAQCVTAALPKLGAVENFAKPAQASGKSPSKTLAAFSRPIEPVGVIAAALRDTPSLQTLRSTRSNSFSGSFHANGMDRKASTLKHKRSNSLPLSPVGVKAEQQTKANASGGSINQLVPENPFMFRYRALMTSKWLSFGRVLFSPVHNELGGPDDRVLVIDGLGNRDWSYYCAESYPQTQVYSLGPSASTPHSGRTSIGNFGSLPNYRHFSYTTPGTDFPFPKGFFAAVVYRFPVADSDTVMKCMVSECKRVLRPGGYLEVSTIDLDLSNMGTSCRRAVRNLKTQMRERTPHISLKPTSDHMQSLIGRRGFDNLKSCIVGVPAAGVISSSRDNSQDGDDVDIGRLATDNSKEGDDHITKMVAQVGRWWYTRSYETPLLASGAPASMWSDRELLKECEELNTTFKLLICHAQKPSCAKRRTVSL